MEGEKKLTVKFMTFRILFPFSFFILNYGKTNTREPGNSNCFCGRGLD